MTTVLLAFFAMLVLVAAMAVGVMFGRKPISGSCGGLANLGIDAECEICGGNPALCEAEVGSSEALGYDATEKQNEKGEPRS